jgi:hypothetical protein
MRADLAATPLSLPSTPSSSSIERIIGVKVAALAGCVVVALMERAQDGAIAPATRRRAAELIASLIAYKMVLPEFDDLARRHGSQRLREYFAGSSNSLASDDNLDDLVEQTLAMLIKVAKTKLN